MGYLFKGVCYPTQADARAAECSAAHTVVVSGTTVYTAQCNSTVYTGTAYTICLRTNGGTCTARTQPVQPDIPCAYDPSTVNADINELFYLGLGVFAALLAARWLYNHFRPDRDAEK